MQSRSKLKTILVLFIFVRCVCGLRVKTDEARNHMLEMAPGKRTLLVGKLLLIPTLAALGAKFVALLPLFLAKLIMLGVLNFVATNINLIATVLAHFKHLFKSKSSAYTWPTQEESLFPAQIDYQSVLNPDIKSVLSPDFKYDYLFNRRTNKPEKTKVLRLVNNNLSGSIQESKPYVSSYLGSGTRSIQSVDGNNNHLTYRRSNPSISPGRYRCYWTTDSTGTTESLLRRDPTQGYYLKNDYNVNDYNVKDLNVKNYHVEDFTEKSYNVDDIDLKDYNIKDQNNSEDSELDIARVGTVTESNYLINENTLDENV